MRAVAGPGRGLCVAALCASTLAGNAAYGESAAVTISAGVPLRVQVDHGIAIKVGRRVTGRLTTPVYAGTQLALPRNTKIAGIITGTAAASKGERLNAVMDGDFTPLHSAVISFDTLILPNGATLPIETRVTERTTEAVHFGGGGDRSGSLLAQAEAIAQEKKAEITRQITAPEKMDRARRFLYGQLPYHPQEIWAGTQFDAELTRPLPVPSADAGAAMPVEAATEEKLSGTLVARLVTDLDSATVKKGAAVRAVVTEPLMDAHAKTVVLPEGTELTGTVLRSQPARSFGRNGALRFTFRNIVPPNSAAQTTHGQVVAAEGPQNTNLSLDAEGGVKAHPDQGRFLAPLALALLAGKSLDGDGSAVAQGAVVSNGFGLVARVVGMAASDRNVGAGFAYYGLAKSVYKRFVARGHDVRFAKNTELTIQLAER